MSLDRPSFFMDLAVIKLYKDVLKKSVVPLEDAELQATYIAKANKHLKQQFIEDVLTGYPENIERHFLREDLFIKKMRRAWIESNDGCFQTLPQVELQKKLIGFTERNLSMVEKIDAFLRKEEGIPLVMVGMAHLIGSGGLFDLLEKKGWTIKPILIPK